MSLSLRCGNPDCQKPLRVRDEVAGKRVKCPACGQVMLASPQIGGSQPASAEPIPTIPSASKPVASPSTTHQNRRPRWPWYVGAVAGILLLGAGFGVFFNMTGGHQATRMNANTALAPEPFPENNRPQEDKQPPEKAVSIETQALRSMGEGLAFAASAPDMRSMIDLGHLMQDIIPQAGAPGLMDVRKNLSEKYPDKEFVITLFVNGNADIKDLVDVLGKESDRETSQYLTRSRPTSGLPTFGTLPAGFREGVPQLLNDKKEDDDSVTWYKYRALHFGTVQDKVKVVRLVCPGAKYEGTLKVRLPIEAISDHIDLVVKNTVPNMVVIRTSICDPNAVMNGLLGWQLEGGPAYLGIPRPLIPGAKESVYLVLRVTFQSASTAKTAPRLTMYDSKGSPHSLRAFRFLENATAPEAKPDEPILWMDPLFVTSDRIVIVGNAGEFSDDLVYEIPKSERAVEVRLPVEGGMPAVESEQQRLPSKTDHVTGTTKPQEAKQEKKALYTFQPLTKDKDKCPGDMKVTLALNKNGELTGYATAFRLEVKNIDSPASGWVSFELAGIGDQTIVSIYINDREVWKHTGNEKDPCASPSIQLTEQERKGKTFPLVLRVGEGPFPVGGIQVFSVYEEQPP